MKKLALFIISFLIGGLLFAWAGVARADFEGEVWHERFGSWLEPIWPEGRDILILGTSKYLNFGFDSGSTGYGIRDNGGVMEWKDSGGAWAIFGSGGGGGSSFSTTSASYFSSLGLAHSTTSVAYQLSQNIVIGNSTSTTIFATTASTTKLFAGGATTTNLDIRGLFTFNGVTGSTWASFCTTITGAAGLCDGSDDAAAGAFATSSANHWASVGLAYSTTSTAYDISTYPKGYFFSTTSAAYWDTTMGRWATTSANYHASVGLSFSTTSALYFLSQNTGNAFSTTSANVWAAAGLGFSTTSANTWSTFGLGFSTTSATYFVHSSTTIPKLYTTNTFSLAQTFTVAPVFSSLTGVLKGNGASAVTVAADGTDFTLIDVSTCSAGLSHVAVTAAGVFTCGTAFSTTSASYFTSVGLAFSTTSTDYWKTTNNFYSTTSANFWSSVGLGHSTTSVAYQLTQPITLGRATSTGFAITSLTSCDTIDTDSSGNLKCGTDATGGGSGDIWPFTASTYAGVANQSTTTPFWLNGTQLIASTTLVVNATTTSLHVRQLTSALALFDANSWATEYTGASCTNQFPRSVDASGAWTCATVATTDVASGITLDTEWDTESEVQVAWGSLNILLETEIDACSELLALLDDETGTCGGAVFSVSPTLTGTLTFANASGTAATSTAFYSLYSRHIQATTSRLAVTSITSAVPVGAADGSFSEVSTQTCTNQFVRAMSAVYVATCSTIAPADVDLTAAWDFGAASGFEIPNGTAPTTDAIGELAWDTTSGQLKIATSTTGHVVIGSATSTLYSFSVASTSARFVSGGFVTMPSHPLPQVVTAVWCKAVGGTSKQIVLSDDGTNDTNTITCTTTGTQFALTSNNSFTAYESIRTEMVTTSGTVDEVVISYLGYRTSD